MACHRAAFCSLKDILSKLDEVKYLGHSTKPGSLILQFWYDPLLTTWPFALDSSSEAKYPGEKLRSMVSVVPVVEMR
jgi:hypothetical protein